jgi:formylglycine-generating enzyme required for sulfatase activity
VYTIGNGTNETRNPSATYFIPSANEWYKAAYHKNDGVTAHYWNYPTSSDAAPFSDQPPGSGAPIQSNTANFFKDDGVANGYDDGYAVTGTTIIDAQTYLTDVGAYTASVSPYGTFDQGGNVSEWAEAVQSQSRSLHGGSWLSPSVSLYGGRPGFQRPRFEHHALGFRVASIPEPCSLWMAALGLIGLMMRRGRAK